MNFLWPASASLRIPCRKTRPLLKTCQKLDIPPIARLTRYSNRSYSISSHSFPRQETIRVGACDANRKYDGQHLRFKSTKRKIPSASDHVITQFERLPQGYEDEEGLAFSTRPLNRVEAQKIFGNVIDAPSANRLLRVMHGRRVAGTLEDPSLTNISTQFKSRDLDIALQWLRDNVLVDEVANAGLRAEQELAELEGETLSDAERMGIYQPNSGEYPKEEGGVYGKGVFQKMRDEQKARVEKKEAEDKVKMSQADDIRQKSGTLATTVNRRSWVSLSNETTNPKILAALEKGKITPDDAPPVEMSNARRLWPSAILLVGILAGCYVFVEVYVPPRKADRMWPDMPPSAATIISIILVNTAVFCAWRVPSLWRTLNKYFVHVPAYPYTLSLVGNIFSHQTIKHFGFNMAVLWFVGTRLHDEIGRGNFLAVYLASGVAGSYASLVYRVALGSFISSSLGASGAICGVLGCYFFLNSSEKVTILGVFPPEDWPSISSMTLLGLLIAADIYGLLKKGKTTSTDHFAHLGGFAVGIGSAAALKDRLKKKRAAELERRRNLGIIDRIKEGRL